MASVYEEMDQLLIREKDQLQEQVSHQLSPGGTTGFTDLWSVCDGLYHLITGWGVMQARPLLQNLGRIISWYGTGYLVDE